MSVDDSTTVYQDVIAAAVNLGESLNTVDDDDERQRLQEAFERRLNDELYHGSQVREAHRHDAEQHSVKVTLLEFHHGVRVLIADGRPGVFLRYRSNTQYDFGLRRHVTVTWARVRLDAGPSVDVLPSSLSLEEGAIT